MHDNRYAFKTRVGFNILGQHITIHLGHFRIDQDQTDRIAQRGICLLRMRCQPLQPAPGFGTIGRMLVLDTELVENLGDLG